ncbi:hypothetical protein DRZ77_00630 [Candidatus Woesearchaeota archaeon]|nr:MAG: hypothetical protein DRZ77_00630 [Candidatus Woesearchaeota archaeon]
MALFGFGKKKPSKGVPIELVVQLKNQGLSNDQIIAELQRKGYSSAQIFDALSEAQLRLGMPEKAPAPPIAPMPIAPPKAPPELPPPPMPESAKPEITKETIEEIAEAIIDEKWDELMKAVDAVIDWKDKAEGRLSKVEQAIEDLKSDIETLKQTIIGRIEEYDKGIKEIGTDVKAMGEVFKKVIPTLTENVKELSSITEKLKKEKTKTNQRRLKKA